MKTQRGRTLIKVAMCLALALTVPACASSDDDRDDQSAESQAGIGVNSFLWRASLDTLAFMPLASVDPFGGVIITDWHSEATTPGERFRATVYILDTRLRADALNVSIFRQTQQNGQWVDATVDPDTAIQIENAILRRARELRLSTVRE
jgi:hypothetical protein